MLCMGLKVRVTEALKSFPIRYFAWKRVGILNLIITYFCCAKYNRINTYYSDIKKHVSPGKMAYII